MLRRAAKATVEHAAIWSGAARVARTRRSADALILAYHNIVPEGQVAAGDLSLHLPQRAFARQLDALRRTHDIVPLDHLLNGGSARRHGTGTRPLAVITFDDAYQGTMTAGVAELRRRDLPATVFVTPAFIGGKPFWWDLIAPPDGEIVAATREHALTACRGRHDEVAEWAAAARIGLQTVPPHARCCSIEELDSALEYPDLSLGSHTWGHPNLTRLTASELTEELHAPQRWLNRFGDRVLPVISYPYGRADATVHAAARAAGYVAGLMIDGGWAGTAAQGGFVLPRLNVPAGVSDAGFALRTAGLLSR